MTTLMFTDPHVLHAGRDIDRTFLPEQDWCPACGRSDSDQPGMPQDILAHFSDGEILLVCGHRLRERDYALDALVPDNEDAEDAEGEGPDGVDPWARPAA